MRASAAQNMGLSKLRNCSASGAPPVTPSAITGMQPVCVTSWRSVTEATAGGNGCCGTSALPASSLPTVSSSFTSPRSTDCASSRPVNTLVTEPISNIGCSALLAARARGGVGGSGL
jgi:hypothetical protein